MYLNVLATTAKTRAANGGLPRFASWQERRRAATLDWDIALLENETDTLKLFALYAQKARR